MLPMEHPLHALVKRSAKGRVKRHRSPLHTLTSIFAIYPSKMEKIPPVRIHPSKRGSQATQIDIPPSKDKSKRADSSAVEQIKVYSDGSAHDGRVGAEAILNQAGRTDRILKLYLGTTEQHTVYEAELAGMIRGLYLIKMEWRNVVKCALSVDNQAALVAIKLKMTKSGQHLVANLYQMAEKLHDCKGNRNFRLTYSLSATRQAHNKKLKRRWITIWSDSPRYLCTRYKDLLAPYSQKYLKYISSEEISRKTASLIFQLRVGHAPINQYLFRFKKWKAHIAQHMATRLKQQNISSYIVPTTIMKDGRYSGKQEADFRNSQEFSQVQSCYYL